MDTKPPKCVFWAAISTWIVTAIRLATIVLPHFVDYESFIPSDWLYSPSLMSILVKPQLTFTHVREARAIQQLLDNQFADAYRPPHQTIRLPPLALALLSPLLKYKYAELYLSILLLLVDLFLAGVIESIGRKVLLPNNFEAEDAKQKTLPDVIQPPYAHIFPVSWNSPKSLLPTDSLPLLAAQLYYWSPAVALSSGIYRCFQNLASVCFVISLHECVNDGSYLLSSFFLALATYMELHYVVFLIPFALWRSKQNKSNNSTWPGVLGTFLVCFACLHGLSWGLVGSSKLRKVLQASYGLGWNNLSPSLSVHWYFVMQLFTRFRDYFHVLLVSLPYILVIPISIRLSNYPMELVVIFSMIWTIFIPVHTIFDLNLSLCFFLFCPRSLARMEAVSFVALVSIWVPVILNVLDNWMWLEPNNGNPNYIFFQSLAYNVFLGILLGQFTSASVQRDKALRISLNEQSPKKSEE